LSVGGHFRPDLVANRRQLTPGHLIDSQLPTCPDDSPYDDQQRKAVPSEKIP